MAIHQIAGHAIRTDSIPQAPCFDRDRDMARGRLAAAKVRAAGGSAIEAAEAAIAATFAPSTHHNLFKRRVRALIRLGPADPEFRFRYLALAEQAPADTKLHQAIWLIEMEYRRERAAIKVSIDLWKRNNRPRIRMMAVTELRLLLRWAERFAPEEFVTWRDAVNGDDVMMAAE